LDKNGRDYTLTMVDQITSEKRSWVMSRVKGRNTTPERIVRSLLHKNGYRFRLHKKDLPGNPDIVLAKYKSVIFIHGCFWHQHKGCKKAKIPEQNRSYWTKKFGRNKKRDEKALKKLNENGWKVLIIWECEIKKGEQFLIAETNSFLN